MIRVLRLSLTRFAKDRSGATAIEYGLIAAMMGVAIIASVFSLGNQTNGMFQYVSNNVIEAHSGN
jgi:pilus assembly protein Flp/PilA